MDDFVTKYKLETIEELQDNLNNLYDVLTELDKVESFDDSVDELFRVCHSIKGNSKSSDFDFIADVAHKTEDILLSIKENNKEFNREFLDILFLFQALLLDSLEHLKSDLNYSSDFAELRCKIDEFSNGTQATPSDESMFLVVDDEPDLVDAFESYIKEEFELSSLTASNGVEAFQKCQEKKFEFIVTDYKMPSMNGGEFIQSLRKNPGLNQKTPIVMVTGMKPMLGPDQKAWENVFFFEKPLEMKKLNYVIKCCLNLNKAA